MEREGWGGEGRQSRSNQRRRLCGVRVGGGGGVVGFGFRRVVWGWGFSVG